jgi:hypothetical protein
MRSDLHDELPVLRGKMAKDIESRSIGRTLPGVSIESQQGVPKVYSSGAGQYSVVFLDAVHPVHEIAGAHEIRQAERS